MAVDSIVLESVGSAPKIAKANKMRIYYWHIKKHMVLKVQYTAVVYFFITQFKTLASVITFLN